MDSLQLTLIGGAAAWIAWSNRDKLAALMPKAKPTSVTVTTDAALTVDEHIAALQRYFAVASKEIRTPALDACDELHAAYDKTETIRDE